MLLSNNQKIAQLAMGDFGFESPVLFFFREDLLQKGAESKIYVDRDVHCHLY